MSYCLGVDLGTSFTAAAVFRDGRSEIVDLGQHRPQIPTVVHIAESGEVVVGDAAERRAIADPEGVVRDTKRRLGDQVGSMVRGRLWSAEGLLAAVLAHVVDVVTARQGGPPAAVALTHPANWGPYKLELLTDVARLAQVHEVCFVAEPVAAAVHYATRARAGRCHLVYDLGGGTFDVTLVRTATATATADDDERDDRAGRADRAGEIVGKPDGLERMGGVDFDEALRGMVERLIGVRLDAIDTSDPAMLRGVAQLRADLVDAKESLSVETSVELPLFLPGLPSVVRLTRSELEEAIRARIGDTMAIAQHVLASAELTDEDAADLTVLLVGGSSRVPLVGRMVAEVLELPTAMDEHPKHPVALGAARLAASTRPDLFPALAVAPIEGEAGEPDGEREPDDEGEAGEGNPIADAGRADDDPDAAAVPAGAGVGRAPWHRRREAALVGALACVLVVVGLAMALRNDGAGADPPTTTSAATAGIITDRFAGAVGEDGDLSISRTWELRGRELTGTLVVRNTGEAPASGNVSEAFPSSMVASLDDISFRPEPATRDTERRTVTYEVVALAPDASQRFEYTLTIDEVEDVQAQLRQWDRERTELLDQAPDPVTTLAQLTVTNPSVEVAPGGHTTVPIAGTMSDGRPAATGVLAGVAATTSDDRLVTVAVDASGLVITGVGVGTAAVTVQSGAATATVTVRVTSTPATDPSTTTTTTTVPLPAQITPAIPPGPAVPPPSSTTTIPIPTPTPTPISPSTTTTIPPPPPPPTTMTGLPAGRYEEEAATYDGGWATCTGQLGQSGGCDRWTSTPGRQYTITFHGTGIIVYGAKAFNGGMLSFTVDGGYGATADSYFDGNANRRVDMAEYYRVTGLPRGDHTLVATMAGGRNPANTQSPIYVTLDAFDVLG